MAAENTETARTIPLGDAKLVVKPTQSPVITFEFAPTFGHVVGLIDVCLVISRAAIGPNGTSIREAEVVANLRCTRAGAIDLREALDKALLMLEPVENPEGPAN